MKKGVCVLGGAALLAASVWADDASFMKGRRFAVGDYSSGKACIVEADGSVSWTQKASSCNDLWIQPGGSILFSTGRGAKEAGKDGAVTFEYKSPSEIFAVQRLADGNTFIAECTSGRLLTLAPDGKTVVKEIALLPAGKSGGHLYIRNARVLPNGNYLVCHFGNRNVTEYAPDGKPVWTFKTPGGPHSAARLANGNTLISCGDNGEPGIVEATPDGKTAWSFTNADLVDAGLGDKPIKFCTGFHKLPNGNLLFSNWLGHNKFGTAPHLLEVTPEKKVVWTFADHKTFRTVSTVQVFGEGDAPLSGEGVH